MSRTMSTAMETDPFDWQLHVKARGRDRVGLLVWLDHRKAAEFFGGLLDDLERGYPVVRHSRGKYWLQLPDGRELMVEGKFLGFVPPDEQRRMLAERSRMGRR